MSRLWHIYLITLCLHASCSKKPTETYSIEGVWSVVENDSLYYEMAFANDHYLIVSQKTGVTSGHYELSDNNLTLINRFGDAFVISEIHWISDHQFRAIDTYLGDLNFTSRIVNTVQSRLEIPIDINALIEGDSVTFREYYQGFFDRYQAWQIGNFGK